ncbi:unnamed protein product [Soboliphyme baturini]|uniref:Ras-GEF domain-containing protein n=1 Tax=Soboliphyme baturini TaxID=241478 RepID=A0A183J1E3_9BILA|nr:unnamed protein product [Soboliphyme baturini]
MTDAHSSSLEWCLCEVSVTPDFLIKQKRLPDQMPNLAERINLNSRYYLKNNNSTMPLVPDDQAVEILKDSHVQFLDLRSVILAAQLTLQDYAVFAAVEPTEYVDNLFRLRSKYGYPKLTQFEELVNREMWWVSTEILMEKNLIRRAKIIKKFIKIAKHCRDFKNFNSMFAIISGLDKPSVRRLHNTWEKVSSKSVKALEDMQVLLDPSRNMSKYRQHLAEAALDPPVIPLFPVLKKDLTFIHECNPTWVEGLVNFEKLRMIAKEIRTTNKFSSAPYALMVRHVKAYLNNFSVVSNEAQLDQMSAELEPQSTSSTFDIGRAFNIV